MTDEYLKMNETNGIKDLSLEENQTTLLAAHDITKPTMNCHIPKLDPYDPEIIQYIRKMEPLNCTQYKPPMTYLENRTWIRINETAAKMYYPEDLSTQCGVIYFHWLVM